MRYKIVRKILSFSLIIGMLSTIGSGIATAAQNTQNDIPPVSSTATEKQLELKCSYPVLRDISGKSFEFTVQLIYSGSTPERFDLSLEAPEKWVASVLRSNEKIEVPAIELTPDKAIPDSVRIQLVPQTGEYPEPGDYIVTLTASSGSISQSINLTATVIALYRFAFYTESELLSADVTAGQSNEISLVLFNTGTAPIQKISFTSEKPSGWEITFTPSDVTFLDAGATKRVIMTVTPSNKTIAGDYLIKVSALPSEFLPSSSFNMPTSHDIELRITVLTSRLWGWVGITIIIVVIACVLIIFRRLGRR